MKAYNMDMKKSEEATEEAAPEVVEEAAPEVVEEIIVEEEIQDGSA